MAQSDHDLLAWRLVSILMKLNQGERLDIASLAEEFNVHKRTIQRDLQERFAFLPLEKTNGLYALNPAYLGRLTFRDVEHFANLAGITGLFPGLDTQFLRELFDSRLNDTFTVHEGSHEDLRQRMGDFRALQQAINERRKVRFLYQKPDEHKWVEVAPYRLINHAGIWYLAADDGGRAKSYTFTKIASLSCLDATYPPNPAISALLDQEDSIWLNAKKTEVILAITPVAAPYFRRRKLISQQVIAKELENGGLIVSGKFAHPNQILPIVRYWIPHARIISPEGWQAELQQGLQAYLNA